MKLTGTPIVIAGMHRSGTSSIANFLSKLGLYLGEPEDMLEANVYNPEGYWEHLKILEVDHYTLAAFGMNYERVAAITEDWLDLPQSNRVVAEIENVLTEHFSDQELWGWKEPRSSVLMTFYNAAFKNLAITPYYVICVRSPLGVAGSMFKREGFTISHSLGLWLHYTLAPLKHSIGHRRNVMIYEDFLTTPRKTAEYLIDSVQGWSPNPEEWSAAVGTVRLDMNHNSQSVKDLGKHHFLVKKTYDLCVEAAAAPLEFQNGAFDDRIESLWEEFMESLQVFGIPLRQGNMALFWQTSVLHYSTSKFRPVYAWQTVKVEADCPPGATVGICIYDLTSVVWIRNAIWRYDGKEVPAGIMAGRNAELSTDGGLQRLAIGFGQEQLITQAPSTAGPFEFEIEFYLEVNAEITLGYLARQSKELKQAKSQRYETARR